MKKLLISVYDILLALARLAGRLPIHGMLLRCLPNDREINIDVPMSERAWAARALLLTPWWEFVRHRTRKGTLIRRVRFLVSGRPISFELNLLEYSQLNYFFGHLQPDLLRLIRQGGERFVDVGGFVGVYACIAAQYFRRVDTFEPHPDSRRSLERHVAINGLNNIRVHPFALSDHDGTSTLAEPKNNQGGSSLEPFDVDDQIDRFRVEVRRFDSFQDPAADKIGLMKIDVENHEESALQGAQATIEQDRPTLFVEVEEASRALSLLHLLPGGYVARLPRTGEVLSATMTDVKFSDIIYSPDAPTCAAP